jgi:hypothetical protein
VASAGGGVRGGLPRGVWGVLDMSAFRSRSEAHFPVLIMMLERVGAVGGRTKSHLLKLITPASPAVTVRKPTLMISTTARIGKSAIHDIPDPSALASATPPWKTAPTAVHAPCPPHNKKCKRFSADASRALTMRQMGDLSRRNLRPSCAVLLQDRCESRKEFFDFLGYVILLPSVAHLPHRRHRREESSDEGQYPRAERQDTRR